MADSYLLENGVDEFLLEDGSGVLDLETLSVAPGLLGGGSLFTPTFRLTVGIPLIGGSGFFDPAFFDPAIFDTGSAVFAPSIRVTVSPPLIGPSGTVFTFTPSQVLPLGVITQTGVTFAPTVIGTSGMPLISGTQGGTSIPLLLGTGSTPSSQALEPRISAPSVKLPPPLGGHTLFAPASFSIQSDPQTVSIPLIGGAVFDPAIFDPAFFEVGVAAFAPVVSISIATTVFPTVLGGASLFTPMIGARAEPGLLGGASQFSPTITLGTASVSPPLIDRTAVLFGMTVQQGAVSVFPNRIGGAVLFSPAVNLTGFSPPLITQIAMLFTPSITGGALVITGFVPIAMGVSLDPGVGSGSSHQPPVGAGASLDPER